MLNIVTDQLIEEMIEKARVSHRKRALKCFHVPPKGPEETSHELQRLVNAFHYDTYAQQHRHGNGDLQNPDQTNPNKLEIFSILRGGLYFVTFDDRGNLVEKVLLSDKGPNKVVENPPGTYHTVVGLPELSEFSVVLEIKTPPYNIATDKFFAPWAPREGSPEVLAYLEDLRRKIRATKAF